MNPDPTTLHPTTRKRIAYRMRVAAASMLVEDCLNTEQRHEAHAYYLAHAEALDPTAPEGGAA